MDGIRVIGGFIADIMAELIMDSDMVESGLLAECGLEAYFVTILPL
jgi:hypothetical protein